MEKARQDAERVERFLNEMARYWRTRADVSLGRGSMSGAMQYHGYAETLAEAAVLVGAHNGRDESGPCVTLEEPEPETVAE